MAEKRKGFGSTLLLIIGCLLPLIFLFLLSGMGINISPWIFLLIFIICPLVLAKLIGIEEEKKPETEDIEQERALKEKAVRPEEAKEMSDLFSWDVFFLKRTEISGESVIFEGSLKTKPESALETLRKRFNEKFGKKYEVLLQQDNDEKAVVVAVPSKLLPTEQTASPSPILNIILFAATLVTTTAVGASHHGVDLLAEPLRFVEGLPYALGIMAVLGVHELGHYIAARRHGLDTTLPFFIPVPFGLGTFGAVIQMKSLVKNRKALFDTGIAGPLAGLAVALPILFIGLRYSTFIPGDTGAGMNVSSSALLAFLAKLSVGEAASASHTVVLHPLAFAGWLGLMITALNLLPIGQLDGGHIGYALFGRKRSEIIAHVAFFAIVMLGIFVWTGWLAWALIIFFLSGFKSMPPMNDVAELDRKRVVLGAFTFVLLFLILSPMPHAFQKALGLHCPYV
ncbi:MAG: site-2 protease family protein [Deltaproteobacteria bacterium]|nr:site-2 protease family protein [Deltaproteobacteria bacterium]